MDTLDFAGGGFHAIFVSGLSSMCRLVNYHFYDPNNVNDSSSVTIRYCSTLGVNELASNANTVSDAFPNPATSVVSVKYNVNTDTGKSYIALYNVLGNELKQIALTTKQGETKINTDELDNGIYFYSLITDHKIVATKKLVVSH